MNHPNTHEPEAVQTGSGESDAAGSNVDDIDAVPAVPKDRLKGVAALKLHLALLIGLVLCALAFRFELSRALGGNSLSWAYVGEWPFFAGFGIYFWWFILNGRERRPKKNEKATVAPEYANMAAQWQQEQRRLFEQQRSSSNHLPSHEVGEEHDADPFDGGESTPQR